MADLTNPRRAKIPTKKPTKSSAKKTPVVKDIPVGKPPRREKKRLGNYPEARRRRKPS